MSSAGTRPLIESRSKPTLQRHARMRHDTTRNRWVILAPERIFELDAIAVAVLRLCDGSRTLDDIADEARPILCGGSCPDPRLTSYRCCRTWPTRAS